jgi:hypothetical protein
LSVEQQVTGGWGGAWGDMNSITDIMKFFATDAEPPLGPGEFKEFWQSLSEEEKNEFRKADLRA